MTLIKSWWQRIKSDADLLDIIYYFISWRVAIAIIGLYAFYRLPTVIPVNNNLNDFWNIWQQYDVNWYIDIARDKYFSLRATAFFPLWPALIKIFSTIFFFLSPRIISIILATFFSFLSVILLYKLILIDFDKKIAKKSVIFLLIFPTSFYLAIGYTEALFLFLLLLAFYSAKKNIWYLVGICGLLLPLTRVIGIAVCLPLLIIYLSKNKTLKPTILYFLLFPLGFGIYLYYLKIHFADPLAFLHAQDSWDRSISFGFLEELKTDFKYFFNLQISDNFSAAVLRINSYVLIIFSATYLIIKKYYSYAIYILLGVLLPLASGTSASFFRYILILFPIYIVLSLISKNKLVYYLLTIIFAGIMVLFLALFVNGYWVA